MKKKKIMSGKKLPLSLQVLSNTKIPVHTLLNTFRPYNWRASSTDALRHVNTLSNGSHPVLYRLLKDFSMRDSLYINENEECQLVMIYHTPHLITFHPDTGLTALEILHRGNLRYEKLVCAPHRVYRSYDNWSVEFFEPRDIYNLKYPTLGLYGERRRQGLRETVTPYMVTFLTHITDFFNDTLYLPYFIHPHRLVLSREEEGSIKLLSGNFLHYCLCPYVEGRKLRDVLFTHPKVIEAPAQERYDNKEDPTTTTTTTSHNVMKKKDKKNPSDKFLRRLLENLVLDFLHSFFVTVLWVQCERGTLSLAETRKSLNGCLGNYEVVVGKGKATAAKKSSIVSDGEFSCQNPFGYCQLSSLTVQQQSAVHEYGCQRLRVLTPIALETVLENHDNDLKLIREVINKELEALRSFVLHVSNI